MTDEDQPTFAMAADPLIGRVLDGRYRIIRKLAVGGMGKVYLAEQTGLDRTVALKVLSVDSKDDVRFRERFFREAKLSSKLTHPNTVRIYDFGQTDDGVFYIAMEYLDGATLSTIIKRTGALDPLRVVNLAMQVCASLAEAHAIGLIHRDLKPDNIIVTQTADGREFVRVVDFGIAKDTTNSDMPTEAGMVYGSPGYMSPEQILDQGISTRSDIYSLGAILYRMATGIKPFENTNPVALLSRHIYSSPSSFREVNPSIEVPGSLEWITMACLSKDPSDRFAGTRDVARALKVVELEARGLLDAPKLSLDSGHLVLPAEIEDALLRFGSDISVITPSPIPIRSPVPTGGADDAVTSPSGPLGDLPSGTVSLSRRLTHPLVLLLGGLVPITVGGVLLLVLLGIVSLLAWRASQPPVADVLPVLTSPNVSSGTSSEADERSADADVPAPGEADNGAPAPEPLSPAQPRNKSRPKPNTKTNSPSTPAPTVSPPAVPAPVVPQPSPAEPPPAPAAPEPPAPEPTRHSDLRNPFDD